MYGEIEKLVAQLEESGKKRSELGREYVQEIMSACKADRNRFNQCSAEHKQLLRQAGHKSVMEMFRDEFEKRKMQHQQS